VYYLTVCVSGGGAGVAIAHKLLVTLRYLLNRKEAYEKSSEEDLAYKMLTWVWHMDKPALNGMTNQQFAK
jgi:hypothetical protein